MSGAGPVPDAVPVLPVTDLTRSLAFYERLGFDVRVAYEGYAILGYGPSELHLDEVEGIVATDTGTGAYLRVATFQPAGQGIYVPASAVLVRGELKMVYVVTGQSFVLRAVRLGAAQGRDAVELLAGVKPGERIALDPVRAGLAGATPAAQ